MNQSPSSGGRNSGTRCGGSLPRGGGSSLAFACGPGEVAYVVVDAAFNESFWSPSLVDWRVERSAAMPARFARRPLVLLDDGRWVVAAEPRP